uniref:Uncharacterized protein n=1 Tax=Chromera velia CCMP2878 TaxID=1169474 RepID=A0A0G4GA80_9ALVE|eukprot:Cvel_20927.t1-p1 / transcript=Cvel_20927.t1 / gene=Cvel_20927 / organism=Chromera_velia_CCMP2878 / gene_product=hypothetical protein / transcript_product=hypothetical protein / location=Cvel_scaffold1920:33122-33487(-) / protein_length=122 / sequence_SO=supercontig / SO=protein_coding / is_pseudo=false
MKTPALSDPEARVASTSVSLRKMGGGEIAFRSSMPLVSGFQPEEEDMCALFSFPKLGDTIPIFTLVNKSLAFTRQLPEQSASTELCSIPPFTSRIEVASSSCRRYHVIPLRFTQTFESEHAA